MDGSRPTDEAFVDALRQYLEDREDYVKGIAALERSKPTITLEELERGLGIGS